MDIILSEYPDKSHNFRNFIFMTSHFSTLLGLGTNLGPGYPVERGRLDQVRSCITMLTRSRAFFIASILRTIRPVLFSKTGNTLESSVEVVKPPLEDMGDGKTKTATFAMS